MQKMAAALIGLWLQAGVGEAATHYLQDFSLQSYQQTGSAIVIQSNGTARLEVRAVADEVFRIWLDADGDLQKKPSVSVLNEHSAARLTVRDDAEALHLISGAVDLRIQKNPLRIDFYQGQRRITGEKGEGNRRITGEKSQAGLGWRDDGAVFLFHDLASDEHIYGLGEDNDAFLGNLDRRGSRRDMWTNQEIRKGHVTADIPINFFMSTSGYGMFFDNSYRTLYDMGAADKDTWSWQAEQGEALFYFIGGAQFPRILDRFTAMTGRPSMPPLWALGFIQSKCCYWDWNEVDTVTKEMSQRQIPFDVMVIDYNWSKVPMDFQWAERWGDVKQKLSAYEQQGRRFLLSTAGPMIRKDASNYQDGLQKGLFAHDANGHTVSCGHYGGDLLDFTNDKIKDWLWPQLKPLYEAGIDGWWLDLTEPEGEPPQTIYQEGPRAGVHNKFSLLNTKAYYEMQTSAYPRDRVFILTRTGFAGIQRYGSAIWTGDTWSDYATFMAHVPEALNTTMSGIPYWTNDTGGFLEGLYKNNLDDHGRLYERWLQFSTYSPLTRVHHVGPSAPYMFGSEVEDSARRYINERYQLLPYIYSYSWEAFRTGSPLMRPLVFDYQDDPAVVNLKDEYLFGKNMLVAPVITEQADQRLVYFPKGRWIDQDYGHEFAGGKQYCVAAPRSRIPVFIRSGAIIPKAPLMQHTGEKPWDPLTLELYPDGESSFRLYQDDGETTDYASQKAYTETQISLSQVQNTIRLKRVESNKAFTPKSYAVRMHLTSRPLTVSVSDWNWDESIKTLSFDWPNTAALEHEVLVTTDGSVLKRPESPLQLEDCPAVPLPKEDDSGAQIPQFWPPPSLPGLVQAENYDKGGEGVAWHDSTKGNQGGEYRQDDVDLVTADDEGGGYAIANTTDGEWYEYTVNASKTGFYTVILRTKGDAGLVHLNGTDAIPLAASTVWQDAPAASIYLKQGEQLVRLSVDQGGSQINALNFAPIKNPSSPAALCSTYKGGYGSTFNCFEGLSCRKINEDWEHNQDPSYWCVVHDW